jgi:hypothetical protein
MAFWPVSPAVVLMLAGRRTHRVCRVAEPPALHPRRPTTQVHLVRQLRHDFERPYWWTPVRGHLAINRLGHDRFVLGMALAPDAPTIFGKGAVRTRS